MPKKKSTTNSERPSYICIDCGQEHCKGLPESLIHSPTFHEGVCDMCGKTSSLTQPRDYGHLSQRAIRMYQKYYEKSLREKK